MSRHLDFTSSIVYIVDCSNYSILAVYLNAEKILICFSKWKIRTSLIDKIGKKKYVSLGQLYI